MFLSNTTRTLGAVYDDTRLRIGEIVGDLDESGAATTVPACPDWSVKDVLAHLAGLCTDVVTGNVAASVTSRRDPVVAWAAAQVDTRRQRSLAEIVDEWDAVGPKVAAIVDDFPGRLRNRVVADITVHEQDLRGAVDRPGARDSEGIDVCLDFLFDALVAPGAAALGLEPLEVRTERESWIVGSTDGPQGDLMEAMDAALMSREPVESPTTAAGSLRAESFELFRALTGRRSRGQIHGLDWNVDPDPYLAIFSLPPFELRGSALIE